LLVVERGMPPNGDLESNAAKCGDPNEGFPSTAPGGTSLRRVKRRKSGDWLSRLDSPTGQTVRRNGPSVSYDRPWGQAHRGRCQAGLGADPWEMRPPIPLITAWSGHATQQTTVKSSRAGRLGITEGGLPPARNQRWAARNDTSGTAGSQERYLHQDSSEGPGDNLIITFPKGSAGRAEHRVRPPYHGQFGLFLTGTPRCQRGGPGMVAGGWSNDHDLWNLPRLDKRHQHILVADDPRHAVYVHRQRGQWRGGELTDCLDADAASISVPGDPLYPAVMGNPPISRTGTRKSPVIPFPSRCDKPDRLHAIPMEAGNSTRRSPNFWAMAAPTILLPRARA